MLSVATPFAASDDASIRKAKVAAVAQVLVLDAATKRYAYHLIMHAS